MPIPWWRCWGSPSIDAPLFCPLPVSSALPTSYVGRLQFDLTPSIRNGRTAAAYWLMSYGVLVAISKLSPTIYLRLVTSLSVSISSCGRSATQNRRVVHPDMVTSASVFRSCSTQTTSRLRCRRYSWLKAPAHLCRGSNVFHRQFDL